MPQENTTGTIEQPVVIDYPHGELKQRPLEDALAAGLGASEYASWKEVKNRCVLFDFGSLEWCDLASLLWLLSLLHHLRRQANDITTHFPEPDTTSGQNFWGFLNRWKFFPALERCVDSRVNLLPPNQVPYTEREFKYHAGTPWTIGPQGERLFTHTQRLLEVTVYATERTTTGQEPTIEEELRTQFSEDIVTNTITGLCGWDRNESKRFVQEVLYEGLRNSYFHAQGSFVTVAMRRDHKYLTVAVSDNGIGIPTVLRTALARLKGRQAPRQLDAPLDGRSDSDLIRFYTEPQLLTDSDLIRAATRGGVTSKADGGGMGLYYARKCIEDNKGELRIRSGTASVDFVHGLHQPSDGLVDSPGTTVRVLIPIEKKPA